MHSVIDLMKEDLKRHQVKVRLPNDGTKRRLYLIMISSMVSRLKDFEHTYGDKVTALHRKLAKKLFGEEETVNTYGVFLNDDLKMVFAFNREFADYDRKKEQVIYKDVDDVLVGKVAAGSEEDDVGSFTIPAPAMPRFPQSGGGSGVMEYSLVEKVPE